jgi:hypothetical protein
MTKGSKAASLKQVPVRQLPKTPIITTFVALLAAIVLGDNMMLVANAITYGQDGMPVSLSGDEFIIVRDTALSDPRVQELIDGRNYSITDCCGFYKDPTSSWQPVINISVDNQLQIGISVDLDTRKVTGIQTMPTIQHQVPRIDSITAAEEVVEQSSSNDGMTSIPFATNTITALPMILVIGIVLGGAAAGIFYYVKKAKNNATNREKR